MDTLKQVRFTAIQSISILLLAFCWISCGSNSSDNESKKGSVEKTGLATMYYGGDIITMEGDSPVYVDALVEKDGKILFVGGKDEAMKMAGEGHRMVDLQGKTLLPGFIDAHGHAYNAGMQALSANLLPAPDGRGNDIPTIISLLKEWASKNKGTIGKFGWIIGFGYDDAQLKEGRHPTADDLDLVTDSVPIVIIHQSGHLAVMNHKALEMSGYDANTKDPEGGVIRRKKGSKEPDGGLEEMAFFQPLFKVMATLDPAANEKLALAGIDAYTRFGFTTLQEGRATKEACETWMGLAKKGQLKVDIACYTDIQGNIPYIKSTGVQKQYTDHFRVAGVKLSLDGSPQGKTAWLTKPYKVPPPGKPKTYVGYPAIPKQADVNALLDTAFANNWQIITHCNGDASLDALIMAVRKAASAYGNDDRRAVVIHAQTARFDQLDSMKVLKMMPSFFGMHTYYWGDWHLNETLGQERAFRISPAATALKKGMIFTQHHDAPVALPSSVMVLYAAVNRLSRTGVVIGPDERVSAYDGLRSITTWAAFQYFEEDSKGTLKAGKLADLVILSENPLKIDPVKIKDIKVTETIKEGNTVFKLQ